MDTAYCVVSCKHDYWIFGDVTMQDDGYYWTVELEQQFNETFKEDKNGKYSEGVSESANTICTSIKDKHEPAFQK